MNDYSFTLALAALSPGESISFFDKIHGKEKFGCLKRIDVDYYGTLLVYEKSGSIGDVEFAQYSHNIENLKSNRPL